MDRSEVSRRIKAARMLAGFTTPQALADSPVCKANGISRPLVVQLESPMERKDRAPRHAKPMELDVIAEACSLPREFFSASFERLASHPALEERMEALERALEGVRERVPDLEQLREEADRQAAEDAAAEGRRAPDGQTHSAPAQ